MSTLKSIPLEQLIEPTEAHRVNIDEQQLNELAESIRDIGLLNPIIVRAVDDNNYEIIAGHRRYLAHRQMGRASIECFVREATDNQVEQGRFAENLQREQLSPMEEAAAIARYMERESADVKTTARILNRSEWWVAHRVALMQMPGELCDMVHADKLAAGTALELAKITDAKHRTYLTEYAVRSGANVGVVREWVNQWEMQQLNNPQEPAPLPDMPVAGQEIVITMPCYLCQVPHDYRQLIIARVCRTCNAEVQRPISALLNQPTETPQ